MKNFVGKMMNLIGTITLILINCFVIVFEILTFLMGETILGDFSDLKLNFTNSYYLLPLILWSIYLVLFIAFTIINLRCLIKNQSAKLALLANILFLICYSAIFLLTIEQRYIQGLDNLGLNLVFAYWCGGINFASIILILIGNILKIRKA